MSDAREPDGLLLERLRGGDRKAAALLMQRHNQTLWRIARGILRDEADAEDAVQDAYLRAFGSISRFRGEASVSSWLARIVINEALRRRSRRWRSIELSAVEGSAARPPETGAPDALITAAPTPEQVAARQQIRRLVERAVDDLPAPFRLVFILRVIEQMSIEETAERLGIPSATVKTRLHRANRQLREALGAEFAATFDGAFPFAGARCERLTAAVLARLKRGVALADDVPTWAMQEEDTT
jgi:RNA polymerase sigma-70 factor (ECF subfamily)